MYHQHYYYSKNVIHTHTITIKNNLDLRISISKNGIQQTNEKDKKYEEKKCKFIVNRTGKTKLTNRNTYFTKI